MSSHPRRIALALVASGLVLGLGADPAAALDGGLGPRARLFPSQRHLLVYGFMTCTRHQEVIVRVTVSQRTTGGWARGRRTFSCPTAKRTWKVPVWAQGAAKIEFGVVTACALAIARERGAPVEARQWCRVVAASAPHPQY